MIITVREEDAEKARQLIVESQQQPARGADDSDEDETQS